MLKELDLYLFSPTGGTEKTAKILAGALAEKVNLFPLAADDVPCTDSALAVFAVPVFAGRIPAVCAERIRTLQGAGTRAVTIAVYGVRAYDDALLELNNTAAEAGFRVIASGAFVAQHSMVPAVGAGRPDAADAADLKNFADWILQKLASENPDSVVSVPGNFPYKPDFVPAAIPQTLSSCVNCGRCRAVCPAGDGKCMLCMACIHACPAKARVLPPPMQEALTQKLIVFKDVRRENETFL